MADPRLCEICGLEVPAGTPFCPRDGTLLLDAAPLALEAGGAWPVLPASAEPASQGADPLLGSRLGAYELRRRIGVGGMGLVYEGLHPVIGKRVAVKVLRPELATDEEQVRRLEAEGRAVNAIRHRGIVDIFDYGKLPDGRQYIIMEYLEGQGLDSYLAFKRRLPVQETLDLLDEVLGALAAAHGAGVVHRDLKPSNIFLVRQADGSRYVKLLDFGLAKQSANPGGRAAQTRTDMVVGTPEYMAPEQARGQAVGPMTDLYAMGVVAFEMVTGQLPFTAPSPVELLMKHVEARPPRPSELVAELPPALDAFILQMLTKDPEVRPGSAELLRRSLQTLREAVQEQMDLPTGPAAPRSPLGRIALPAEPLEEQRPTPVLPLGTLPTPPLTPATSPELPVARSSRGRLALVLGLGLGSMLAGVGLMFLFAGPPSPAPSAEPRPTPPASPEAQAASPAPEPLEPAAAPPAPDTEPPATPADTSAAQPTAPNMIEPVPLHQAPSEPRPSEPRARGPAQEALLDRLALLRSRMDERQASGRLSSPAAARSDFSTLRIRVLESRTASERRQLSKEIDSWEARYLKAP